jgi:hypothetical protein
MCETKPIGLRLHPTTGSNGAKQTQFEPAGAATGGTECAKQTQSSPASRQAGSARGGNVRNKPNLRRSFKCEVSRFKSTQARVVSSESSNFKLHTSNRGVAAFVRNKANSHPQGRIGGASPTLRVSPCAPNKANSAKPTGRPDPRRAKRAKQTQFPAGPSGPGRGRCRAKQSQSSGHGVADTAGENLHRSAFFVLTSTIYCSTSIYRRYDRVGR